MGILSTLWSSITGSLFPAIEEEMDPLTEKQRELIAVCELAQLDKHMARYTGHWLGRHKKPRIDFAKAFVAKAVYNFPTTKLLVENLRDSGNLRRLCGWEKKCDVPSEPTFSRAFAEFAASDLGDIVHNAMFRDRRSNKLAGHINRDATAIVAREKAAKKPAANSDKPAKPKRKRGRPRRGEMPEPKEIKRMDLQGGRSLEDNLKDLPAACDWGAKRNSQGKQESWKGYKLHVDCVDGSIPVSVILTSASLHDSQVAIPLAQISADRVVNLYDLMDSAYDAGPIDAFSRSLGHVPIIDPNPRRGEARTMDPATARRYDERTDAERFNSLLKDNYGGRYVRVKGNAKVKLHLMFGVIAICAMQLIRMLE